MFLAVCLPRDDISPLHLTWRPQKMIGNLTFFAVTRTGGKGKSSSVTPILVTAVYPLILEAVFSTLLCIWFKRLRGISPMWQNKTTTTQNLNVWLYTLNLTYWQLLMVVPQDSPPSHRGTTGLTAKAFPPEYWWFCLTPTHHDPRDVQKEEGSQNTAEDDRILPPRRPTR